MTAFRMLVLVLPLVFAVPPANAGKKKDAALLAEARAILENTPLIDGHNDLPWQIRDRHANKLDGLDLTDTTGAEKPIHTDLTRLEEGGVGGVFWSVWVPHDDPACGSLTAVLEQIDLVHRMVEQYPDDLELARTAADVRRIHGEGRLASMIGVEGGYVLDDSLAVLRQLYALDVRYMSLTHWRATTWCDAGTTAPEHEGLAPFGEAVVREMNRLGTWGCSSTWPMCPPRRCTTCSTPPAPRSWCRIRVPWP